MKVKSKEIREMLGLSEPEEQDEIIGGIIENEDKEDNIEENNIKIQSNNFALNNENINNNIFQDDYIEIEDDIIKVLEDTLNRCKDFEGLKEELEKLTLTWNPEKQAKLMASAFFIARAKGDNNFNKDTNLE